MKESDMLKDLLQYVSGCQREYNEGAIKLHNPEARQLFTQLRDNHMRIIVKLQQKIERLESKPRIIAKILPSKTRY